MYRSRLVPRVLPILGLIGAALLLAGDAAVLFGLIGRVSPLALICRAPDRIVGVFAGHLAHRQGIQSFSPHFRARIIAGEQAH